ncbi:MAG: T9SS type A sorting domain-containing protein, partial [Paludibacteraceae bacterium]|nr:T9SS type A sorting domain-containing protein [Paludibacteraceae bacterium]
DMFDVQSSKIPTALDQYKENIPYAVQYKLDEPGIHYANIMFWGQDKDEKGKFTTIAYYTVKGVTAYNKEEVVIETPSLPEDTTTLQKGDTLANPFVVKDTLGNELPKDSVNYKYEISPEGGVTIDENGNIIPQCVGTTRIIAMLQPNTLVPAKADTIFIYVAEESKNVIKWNLPETIAKGDTLPAALASTEDEAEMTYEFIPATAVEEVTGGYQVMQAGAFQIVAKAAQTCDHFAMDSTVNVYANGVVGSIELNSTVDPLNLNVLDTIKNMFVVLGESGDTLDAPEANITYAIEPAENMHLDENGNFVVDRSGDVKVTVTVAGDTLKPATQEFNFKLKAVKEQIFDNMLDTLLLGKDYTYDLKNYFTTLSPLGIDSVSVPKTYEGIVDINGCVVTPVSKGVVRLIVTAKGNDDFTGPVEKVHEITVVGVVKEINWNEALKEELEEPRVGDVIHTGDVPVYDEEGHQIPPEQVERTYVINPEGAAHVTPEGDLVVDLPIDPITVVVTTEVEGMETKIDTITIHGKPASISEIELPEEVVKGEAHIGDIVSLDNVKVYDQNGKDITDQIDKIEYIIEPEGVAHIDENGNLVIDKAEPFTITTKVTDPLVDPEKSSYVTPVTVAPFQVNEVTIPEIPTDLNPGDVLDMNDVKVYDKDGKDITDKCKVEYTFEPEGSAQYNPNTGEIEFIKASEITVKTTISGEGVETKTIDTKVNVDAFTPATDFKLPEPEEGFHAGDIIPVEILDENGERINDFVDIDVKINPADKAEYNPETGEITIKEGVEGPVDVTITVGGDNVQPAITYTETIYVHHDETGCYDYMVQLWNDVAIINNNNETASFVRYEWYKDGKLVAGQNSQDYHEANGAAMNGIYYAYAYDEAGNKFMICEKEFNGAAVAEIVKPSPVVIPTIMAPGRTYTIETADEGQVVIMNTNGAVMDNFNVKAGVNTQIAPASSGVFILQYTATDGQAKACKLIVK